MTINAPEPSSTLSIYTTAVRLLIATLTFAILARSFSNYTTRARIFCAFSFAPRFSRSFLLVRRSSSILTTYPPTLDLNWSRLSVLSNIYWIPWYRSCMVSQVVICSIRTFVFFFAVATQIYSVFLQMKRCAPLLLIITARW